jgi:hypothetical protein
MISTRVAQDQQHFRYYLSPLLILVLNLCEPLQNAMPMCFKGPASFGFCTEEPRADRQDSFV